ncbi:MAG TPA: EAL domain-containing protein [Variovorax sp.]|nr:EAL domain-containing protein [Variovorax sp.]
MRIESTAVDEEERLDALGDYRLAEEEENLGLDEIVNVTSQLLCAPIALVSLVERTRLFFKSRVGVDVCEISREGSFCSHALHMPDDEMLVVPDARLDPRFVDIPLVRGAPFIRFYAGMPLRSPLGHVLGTLCVADTVPRARLTDRERTNLRAMALMVLDRLELRRLAVAGSVGQSRFENIAATSPDGIVCSDARGIITFWNGACERLFGIPVERALGANIDIIIPPRMRGGHEGGMRRVAEGGAPKLVGRTIELDAIHANGTEFPVELSLSMWQEGGRTTFGAIIRDISARRADEARLFDLAHLDSLSGLPNRGVLLARIADHVAKARPFALLMLDLDGFKDVNDTLGHSAGDAVLRQAARRLRDCVGPADTVARLGGDEFSILMADDDGARVDDCARRILEAVAAPMAVDGQTVHVTASIGIARCPADGRQVGDLLSAADLAMYHAKAEGRNCLSSFTHGLRDAVLTRRAFEGEIRRAIEHEEFELFYQPQVRIADGALLGLEALLRWRHPVEGLLAPYRFLSTIESGPFAADVGRWVMAAACAHAVRLRERVPHLRMGVNLFGAQFRTGRLAREVMEVLERTRLPPDALELEITENIILQHDELMLEPLRVLRTLGVGIAFDDYGTGFASLSLLKRYPITRLKIDRSFVKEICTDHTDAAIVEMVIDLTEKIGIEVIAEGVEEIEQRDALQALGCEVVQGYLYGKPMSVPDLDAFIAARTSVA